MELLDFLNEGVKKAGSLTALGKALDLSQPRMSAIKAGNEPLPDEKAVELADYIGAEPFAVIAAAKYANKKNPKREFWHPFVATAAQIGRHAPAAILLAVVMNLVTPAPAEANTHAASSFDRNRTFCIMLSIDCEGRPERLC